VLALSVVLVALGEGSPLFYWGGRPAVVVAGAAAARSPEARSLEARVTEVHAAIDRGEGAGEGALVLRFTFDRAVGEALRLPDGTPVSGRLRAILYLDTDDDRATGFDAGAGDLRSGADCRLEIGVVSLAADAEEQREASALVSATLVSLSREGRRRRLWTADDDAAPSSLSAHGEWVELRVPREHAPVSPRARLILAQDDHNWDGRLRPQEK
jgi:hypothetical protein